jgi:methionyl aminopeptidase
MAIIQSEQDLNNLKHSCKILMSCFYYAKTLLKPGLQTSIIDKFAQDFIRFYDGEPSFLGYNGFKYSVCVSINDEVVHGIAPETKIIPNNSLVKLDMGVIYKKMFSDSAQTYIVGEVSKEAQQMVSDIQVALKKGIEVLKDGAKVGDIGFAIEEFVGKKYGNVTELGGHGVGYAVHEAPFIPHQGKKGKGVRFFENQAICIEPMFTLGSEEVIFDETKSDGWTVKTKDGSLAAHWEHTILIKKKGYEILTDIPEEELLSLPEEIKSKYFI